MRYTSKTDGERAELSPFELVRLVRQSRGCGVASAQRQIREALASGKLRPFCDPPPPHRPSRNGVRLPELAPPPGEHWRKVPIDWRKGKGTLLDNFEGAAYPAVLRAWRKALAESEVWVAPAKPPPPRRSVRRALWFDRAESEARWPPKEQPAPKKRRGAATVAIKKTYPDGQLPDLPDEEIIQKILAETGEEVSDRTLRRFRNPMTQ